MSADPFSERQCGQCGGDRAVCPGLCGAAGVLAAQQAAHRGLAAGAAGGRAGGGALLYGQPQPAAQSDAECGGRCGPGLGGLEHPGDLGRAEAAEFRRLEPGAEHLPGSADLSAAVCRKLPHPGLRHRHGQTAPPVPAEPGDLAGVSQGPDHGVFGTGVSGPGAGGRPVRPGAVPGSPAASGAGAGPLQRGLCRCGNCGGRDLPQCSGHHLPVGSGAESGPAFAVSTAAKHLCDGDGAGDGHGGVLCHAGGDQAAGPGQGAQG